ncbi:MAG: cupredoxin domain-containing protein, partial [Anaerolineales bacterium]|nr:cupredoxin domain-containing protein [Anaerolineales bacterium]
FLAACAPTPTAQAITITAQGMTYQPASFEVTSGQPVRLVFQNDDVVEHDFSIIAFPMSQMSSQQEEMAGHNMGDMTSQPELHVAAPVGGQGVLEFTPSKPGTYAFSCTVAGHMEAGMLGTLTVRAP